MPLSRLKNFYIGSCESIRRRRIHRSDDKVETVEGQKTTVILLQGRDDDASVLQSSGTTRRR